MQSTIEQFKGMLILSADINYEGIYVSTHTNHFVVTFPTPKFPHLTGLFVDPSKLFKETNQYIEDCRSNIFETQPFVSKHQRPIKHRGYDVCNLVLRQLI